MPFVFYSKRRIDTFEKGRPNIAKSLCGADIVFLLTWIGLSHLSLPRHCLRKSPRLLAVPKRHENPL